MYFPRPEQLASALAQTSLSENEKREILVSLPYLNTGKIANLYRDLLSLLDEEEKFLKQVERVDFKYKIKVQQEMERVAKSV